MPPARKREFPDRLGDGMLAQDRVRWDGLRRRKVVQWGIAYVAGSWALLQGLEYLSGTFDWPRQIQQLATIALVGGFPVALVLSWYHGDRGQQRVTAPEFAWLVVLCLLGGGALWFYDAGSGSTPAASDLTLPVVSSAAISAIADPRPSIAVLPFDNRSRLDDDAYFVDGIQDDILTQLSKVSALRVISRTSVEQFRDTKLPISRIAELLGVTRILEGAVQRAGDRVRINVQLIDATGDAHLWGKTYDRELTLANIFEIQSEVATAVADELEASLTAVERARVQAIPTQSLEAWEAYQLGKRQLEPRTAGELREAERQFRSAVATDPGFALAWAQLAITLALQTTYASRPSNPGLVEAGEAADIALALAPDLAEGWAAAGLVAYDKLEFERATTLLSKAIELNSNFAPAHQWLSITFAAVGDRKEALLAAERAAALDPRSAIIQAAVGWARTNVGRFDDALVAYGRALEINPGVPNTYANIGEVFVRGFGRLDRAIPWFEKAFDLDPANPTGSARVALAYWQLGDDSEAGRWLARSLALGEGTAYTNFVAALLFLSAGNTDGAHRHAARASELDPFYLYFLRNEDLRRGDYAGARARYAKAIPQLLVPELPKLNEDTASIAIDLALVLQHTDEGRQARLLLDRSEEVWNSRPVTGADGPWIAQAQLHAVRGETKVALAKLREAERAGSRDVGRYLRDFEPNVASIRDEPAFKAVFADIEREMARQRAALAARPRDAPLELPIFASRDYAAP